MCEHATHLTVAENDLARLRALIARATTWINNPTYDITARTALAQHLGLPEPRQDP